MYKEEIIKIRQLIKSGNLAELKVLFKDNQELINAETAFGTWLEVASAQGQMEIVKFFIGAGIDVNKSVGVTNGSPIESASFRGYLNIVKILYESGARLDVSDFDRNLLFAAINNNHFDVVRFLVEKGIDLSASYAIGDLDACDAYEYARQYGRTEIAEYLKEQMEKQE